MDSFTAEREAARAGIVAAGAEPILIEDSPSQGHSSRTACLDAVASCDALVVVVGKRGGWQTDSGKLVVEEEVQEALDRSIPVRVFGERGVERDAAGVGLYRRLSDYVDGFFRKEYQSTEELTSFVSSACADIPVIDRAMSVSDLRHQMRELTAALPRNSQQQGAQDVTLRLVIAPTRSGCVITAAKIDDTEFQHQLVSLATSPRVAIASYDQGLAPSLDVDDLHLTGNRAEDYRQARSSAIRIKESGILVIDVPLETRGSDAAGMSFDSMNAFSESRLRNALKGAFTFAHELYQSVDPYKRHERFMIDAALYGAAGKDIVAEEADLVRPLNARRFNMTSMSFMQGNQSPVLCAREEPDVLSRRALERPEEHVTRLIRYLKRRVTDSKTIN